MQRRRWPGASEAGDGGRKRDAAKQCGQMPPNNTVKQSSRVCALFGRQTAAALRVYCIGVIAVAYAAPSNGLWISTIAKWGESPGSFGSAMVMKR